MKCGNGGDMSSPDKVKCPQCGKRIDTDDRYCGYCGEENNYYDVKCARGTGKAAQRDRIRFRIIMSLLAAGFAGAVYYLTAVVKLL